MKKDDKTNYTIELFDAFEDFARKFGLWVRSSIVELAFTKLKNKYINDELSGLKVVQLDERGTFLNKKAKDTWKEINVLELKKKFVRGGHYHKKLTETFIVISGSLTVAKNNIKTKKLTTFNADKYTTFVVRPYETHTLKAEEDSIVISLLDREYKEGDLIKT